MTGRIVADLAGRMLLHNRARFVSTVAGIAIAFFLAAAQVGLLVGWSNTISAIINHAGVDIWVMARQTPTFDYGTAIPRHRIQQVRSVPGVVWAEGLFTAWNIWQHRDGRHINVELIGLDDGSAGGPWDMRAGSVQAVHVQDTVLVDEHFLDMLGVHDLGDSFEITGKRARVGGISRGVRSFTAAPFVFTSIESAIAYDKRYRDDEITYVLARCVSGQTPEAVRARIAEAVGNVEVLTTPQFALRSVKYWLLETGVGITVVITAVLGLAVGAVIISQTLFAITQDHLANYASLLALGFHHRTLRSVVLLQSLSLGVLGVVFGALLFASAAWITSDTPIPLETTPAVSFALAGLALGCCAGASWISVRTLFRIDPVAVFHG